MGRSSSNDETAPLHPLESALGAPLRFPAFSSLARTLVPARSTPELSSLSEDEGIGECEHPTVKDNLKQNQSAEDVERKGSRTNCEYG